MKNTYFSGGGIQRLLLALFCLMIIIAGSVFILDQWREPYHGASIPPQINSAQLVDAAALIVASNKKLATPAKSLHMMDAEADVDILPSIHSVVGKFDESDRGRVLESYLIWAIHNAKSDAYIDSLLNSAASKGHFAIPEALLTLSGRLDTPSLLASILLMAQNAEPIRLSHSAPHQHLLRPSDSFAGLALAYYGHPLDHARISDANGMDALMAEAQVGQVVKIPGL